MIVKTIRFNTYLDALRAVRRAKKLGYTIDSKEMKDKLYFSELPVKSVYHEYTVRMIKDNKLYVFWSYQITVYNKYRKVVK